MRTVLFHLIALLVTITLYCLIVPQARTDLLSAASLGQKMEDVGVRMLCVYFCFLFVYYAVFRAKAKAPAMPDEGAYGGYRDASATEADGGDGGGDRDGGGGDGGGGGA